MYKDSRKQIWIRADGNEEIASGHLMRTLSIAFELRKRGAGVQYILANETSLAWLRRMEKLHGEDGEKLPAAVLELPYGNPDAELPLLKKMLRREKEQPDLILVDSYAASSAWMGELRGFGVPVACIDDEMRTDLPADLVVNYDPNAEEQIEERLASQNTAAVMIGAGREDGKYLLGPSYAPLRAQFEDLTPMVRQQERRIFISTGGTDPYKAAGTLEQLTKGLGLEAVVMAPGYPPITQAAKAMQSCDLAISAAGTTLYELCAAGVPTLCYSMADNQEIFAKAMERAGTVSYLGDIRTNRGIEPETERILHWVEERRNPSGYAVRCAEARRMHQFTDGKGAGRIAEAILSIVEVSREC